MNTETWAYDCVLENRATGERRTIVVELSDEERNDPLNGTVPVGGHGGLISNGHALRRAGLLAPEGFIAIEVIAKPIP
jgi:hypothetical protein